MDAYLHVISVIKKLGYICDTSPYLTDYQYRLFSRRSNNTICNNMNMGVTTRVTPIFFIILAKYI